MADRINKVILILDRNYGEELSSLAMDSHVWLIDSPTNGSLASSYWAAHESNVETGVTTFEAAEADSNSEICLMVLDDIDVHHGEYSSDPPYSVLEVVGGQLTEPVKLAIQELGFNTFELTDRGFRASR